MKEAWPYLLCPLLAISIVEIDMEMERNFLKMVVIERSLPGDRYALFGGGTVLVLPDGKFEHRIKTDMGEKSFTESIPPPSKTVISYSLKRK